jgi:hypothetical protein
MGFSLRDLVQRPARRRLRFYRTPLLTFLSALKTVQ